MKRLSILILCMLVLTACKTDSGGNTSEQVISRTADSFEEQEKGNTTEHENNDNTIKPEAHTNASKMIPEGFSAGLLIESFLQNILIDKATPRVEQDNAIMAAYKDMKSENNKLQASVKYVNDTKYKDMLKKKKQFLAYLDAFIYKVAAEQIYTIGNIAIHSDYAILRSDTTILYLISQPITYDSSSVLDEQLKQILVFNSDISQFSGQSVKDLEGIAEDSASKLQSIIYSTSNDLFKEYYKKYKDFIAALKEVEDAVIGNSLASEFYIKLNASVITNLYERIKDNPQPEPNVNVNVEMQTFIAKWL